MEPVRGGLLSKARINEAYGSYDALLEDDEIEVVSNSLSNSMYVEWSIRALEAGKHMEPVRRGVRHSPSVRLRNVRCSRRSPALDRTIASPISDAR